MEGGDSLFWTFERPDVAADVDTGGFTSPLQTQEEDDIKMSTIGNKQSKLSFSTRKRVSIPTSISTVRTELRVPLFLVTAQTIDLRRIHLRRGISHSVVLRSTQNRFQARRVRAAAPPMMMKCFS